MGYERKRGKLGDLNALLRGDPGERFSLVVGNTKILSGAKYVITLDTDTQLPRDSARQLVGAMAHPLNRAHYDEGKQRVVAGYSILQPRVAVSLPGTNRSRYARMEGSDSGIDPYTRAVSDVYQDLFGEGSFVGKGIYDVEAFEQSLAGRVPENSLLSHDLFEGLFARVALCTDLDLIDAIFLATGLGTSVGLHVGTFVLGLVLLVISGSIAIGHAPPPVAPTTPSTISSSALALGT
jgi:hypothetical protein